MLHKPAKRETKVLNPTARRIRTGNRKAKESK
jgi:hypothetical protein